MKTSLILLASIFISFSTSYSQIRVACIGNSITYGAGIDNRDSLSYPAQMGRILGKNWSVENFGISGSTMLRKGDKPYWKESRLSDAISFAPNVVVLKLGTNDSKPQNQKYKDDFEKDYLAMIDTLQALATHPTIFVCLPVPAYGSEWGISDSVIRYEIIPKIKVVAKQRNIKVINLYKSLSNHPEYFPDLIHPNAQGAGVMAKHIACVLRKNIKVK